MSAPLVLHFQLSPLAP